MFLILSALAAAAPTDWSFAFVGQPDCVELVYADGRTQLTNGCTAPILVSHTVQLASTPQVLPAGSSTQIRDQSAFTLGMDGQLFNVVAVVQWSE